MTEEKLPRRIIFLQKVENYDMYYKEEILPGTIMDFTKEEYFKSFQAMYGNSFIELNLTKEAWQNEINDKLLDAYQKLMDINKRNQLLNIGLQPRKEVIEFEKFIEDNKEQITSKNYNIMDMYERARTYQEIIDNYQQQINNRINPNSNQRPIYRIKTI